MITTFLLRFEPDMMRLRLWLLAELYSLLDQVFDLELKLELSLEEEEEEEVAAAVAVWADGAVRKKLRMELLVELAGRWRWCGRRDESICEEDGLFGINE